MNSFDLVSDLHLDMRPDPLNLILNIEVNSETLVIAGDMCELVNINPDWLEAFSFKYENIVYVPGNHEYFHSNINNAKVQYLESITPANWHTLDCKEITINGINFAGATLWYPQCLPTINGHAFADFRFIKDAIPNIFDAYEKAVQFFERSNAEVWITHHLPLAESIHQKYANDPTNIYYLGSLQRAIMHVENLPKVIVHGHTHESFHYMYGDVQVHCNPFGYTFEGRREIQPRRIEF